MPPPNSPNRFYRVSHSVPEIALLALLYYLTGRVGTMLAIPPGVATVIWPPSGVALAVMLLRGDRLWLGVFLGAMFLDFGILNGKHGSLLSSVPVAAGISAGSTVQALLGTSLIRRLIGTHNFFNRTSRVAKFVGIAIVSCLIAATIGAGSLCLGGFAPWSVFAETWLTWWLGDAVGILVVTPFILVWSHGFQFLRERTRRLEFLFLLCALMGVSQFVFGIPVASSLHFPMAYLFIPLIIWISFRMGLPGGVTAVFVTSVLAICGTINGTTQFVGSTLNESLLSVQLFVAVASITGLSLGAVLLDRKRLDEEKGRILEAEKKLRLELSRSNEDLERFARIASHDLREPLRTINSHLGLLMRTAEAKFNDEEKLSVGFVLDGSARMQRLIKALLGYSMPGAKAADFQMVACDDVLKKVLGTFELAIEEANAKVTVDPLPTVRGDGIQFEQLFQNLVGNALKYHAEQSPLVHISCRKGEEGWIFSVQDNGIGIDMQYADKIFQAFQRLHGSGEYPGSGLGLSVCRKIVEHHGGKIWVESNVGQGSRFYFTIPSPAPT